MPGADGTGVLGTRGAAAAQQTALPAPLCLTPVPDSVDHVLVRHVCQPVKRTIAEDGIVEQAQPFVHTPI